MKGTDKCEGGRAEVCGDDGVGCGQDGLKQIAKGGRQTKDWLRATAWT